MSNWIFCLGKILLLFLFFNLFGSCLCPAPRRCAHPSCIEPRVVGRQHLLRFSMPFKDIYQATEVAISSSKCRPLFSSITNYYGQNALKRRINNIETFLPFFLLFL